MSRNTSWYGLANTDTFRRVSRKLFDIWGGNLQNIEKSVRQIYIPDGFSNLLYEKCLHWLKTGETSQFTEEELVHLRVFGQIDQSGAEALIVAYMARKGMYRELFIHGVKPHVYIAMKLFKEVWRNEMKQLGSIMSGFDIDVMANTPISQLSLNPYWGDLKAMISKSDDWPINRRYYYFAKQTCHSANYGIEANTFRMNVLEKSGGKVVLPREEAGRFLAVYRGEFPEIPEWNEWVIATIKKTGMLYNMQGFPLQVTDYYEDYKVLEMNRKEYIAWGPQSTVGEITRRCVSDMQDYIEQSGKRWDILADTHDSMLNQFPLTDTREWMRKASECMNQELVGFDGTPFRMKSEINIGFNWSSQKKETNELGLQMPKWLNS